MDSFEIETHATIAVLEEMLASYQERIPCTHLAAFKRSVTARIGRAKAHLLLLDNIA